MSTDAHSHLSFLSPNQVSKLIESGRHKGLDHWILGGYDAEDWQQQLILRQQFPKNISVGMGIHPWVVIEKDATSLDRLWAELEKQIHLSDWVGETGLDLSRAGGAESLELQKQFLEKHLKLAGSKPLILHVVQAHQPCLEILSAFKGLRGIVHGFSGSYEVACQYLARGFLISLGAGVFKEGFGKLKKTVAQLQSHEFVLESDQPGFGYGEDAGNIVSEVLGVPPGGGNEPVETFFRVAQAVAEIRQEPVLETLDHGHENLQNLVCGT